MIIRLPPTWIQQLPYFRMEVPAKVRVVFRQIEQFGVKFHFPPYRSPHWPPNNGFLNLALISLFSEQNCSQFFLIFRFWKPDLASIARAAFHTWTYNHRHLLQDNFFQIKILIQKLGWGYFRKVWNLTYGSLAAKDLVSCSSSIVVGVDLSPLHGWADNASSLGRICLIEGVGWCLMNNLCKALNIEANLIPILSIISLDLKLLET